MTDRPDWRDEHVVPDGRGDPPSESVIELVADAQDTNPLELPPLYEAVDPDAMDGLFRESEVIQIQFEYAGCTVIVATEGDMTVCKIIEDTN